MAIKIPGRTEPQDVKSVKINDNTVNIVNLDGVQVWGREITLIFSATNCSWGSESRKAYYGDILGFSALLNSISCEAYAGVEGKEELPINRWSNTVTKNTDNDNYHYGFLSISPTTSSYPLRITPSSLATLTISASAPRYPKVHITAGAGIKDVYWSNVNNCLPTDTNRKESGGWMIGTGAAYAFIVLNGHYTPKSGWVLVSGTAGEEDAVYRVDSAAYDDTPIDFGTINADIDLFTVQIYYNVAEIAEVYYKANGGDTWLKAFDGDTINDVEDLSTFYYYIVPASHYHTDYDEDNPNSFTIACSNVTLNLGVAHGDVAIDTFTITWKYLNTCPKNNTYEVTTRSYWTEDPETYNYGDTPSRGNPHNVLDVESDGYKRSFDFWDDLSTVTANRTITAYYDIYNYVSIGTCSHCHAKNQSPYIYPENGQWVKMVEAARVSGVIITETLNNRIRFETDTHYAFSLSREVLPSDHGQNGYGVRLKDVDIIRPGSYSADASLVYYNIVNGTHSTVTVTDTNSDWSHAGNYWHTIDGVTATWSADILYAFDASGKDSDTTALTPGDTISISANYGVLSVTYVNCTPTGSSNGFYSLTDSTVKITVSAVTGPINNDNKTRFYFDKTKASTLVTGWDFETVINNQTASSVLPYVNTMRPHYCTFDITPGSADHCYPDLRATIERDASDEAWFVLTDNSSSVVLVTSYPLSSPATVAYRSDTGYAWQETSGSGQYITYDYVDYKRFEFTNALAATHVTHPVTHVSATYTLQHCTGTLGGKTILSGIQNWYPRPSGGSSDTLALEVRADTGWSFDGENLRDYYRASISTANMPIEDTIGPEYCQVTLVSPGSYITTRQSGSLVEDGTYIMEVGTVLEWHADAGYDFVHIPDPYTPTESISGPGTYSHLPEIAHIYINESHCGLTDVTAPQGITTIYSPDTSYDGIGIKDIYVLIPPDTPATDHPEISGFTVSLRSGDNYYYGSTEADKTATITQVKAPGTYSNNPGYVKAWFTGTNCVPQVYASGAYSTITSPSILAKGTSVYSYANGANVNYSYNSSGTAARSSSLITVNAPGTYALYEPTYCYITIVPIFCSVVVKDKNQNTITLTSQGGQLKGWVASEKYQISINITANPNYSFSPTKTDTTQTLYESFAAQTIYVQPYYCAITLNNMEHCSVQVQYEIDHTGCGIQEWHNVCPSQYNYPYIVFDSSEAFHNILRFTADTNYSYNGNTTTDVSILGPGNYTTNPTHAYLTITRKNCVANRNSGWYKLADYPSGVDVTFTADDNRAFTATPFSTTYTNYAVLTGDLPGSVHGEPTYVKVQINCTNCTASIDSHNVTNTSYWYNTDKVIDLTASSGYAFSAIGEATTEESLTATNPATLSFSPVYGYYNFVLDHSTYKSGKANNYVGDVGESCSTVITANTYYSYIAGSTRQADKTISGTIPCTIPVTDTEPGYIRAKSIQSNASCNPYVGSSLASASTYYAKGTKWNWKANAGYAFDSNGTNAQETTLVVGSDMSNTAPYIKAASITGVNVQSIDKDASTWYLASSNPQITWTAEEGYHFGSSNDTTTVSEALTPNGIHSRAAVRNTYTITFSVPSGSNFYGYWIDEDGDYRSGGTRTAYYGDKIIKSGTTVTCYTYDDLTVERWSMTAISNSDAEYDYTTPTISGNNINSVTANATFQASNTRSKHEYKVTWRYMNSYDNWTTVDTWYYLNDSLTSAPRRGTKPTPVEVVNAANTYRFVPLNWDNTGTVTQNVTVEEEYRKDFYAKITSTRGYFVSIDDMSTRQIYEYEDWFEVMNASGVGHTFEFHADQYCAFDSAGQVETLTKTINAPGTYNYSFDYIQVEVTKTANCNTATKSTGWHAYNTQCTWTAKTGYASNSSGNTTYTKYFTTPGATYTDDGFSYVYLTINRNNCVAASGSVAQGWYELGASTRTLSVKSTANTGWSFLGFTAQDTDTYTVDYPTAPKTVTHAPIYFYLTFNGTNCHAVYAGTSTTLTSGFFSTAQTFYWKTDDDNSYAFTSDGAHTTSNTTTTAYPNTYTKTAGYGKYTVSTGSRYTANVTTGWYQVTSSKTTRFTAKSGWSFGGSSVGDYVDKSAAVPGSVSANPTYCQVTVTGTHYSSFTVGSTSYTSTYTGIVKENTQIRWNAASGYALNYAGDTYDTETIIGPDTYEGNFNYGFVIITNVRNCTTSDITPYSGGYMEVFGLNSSPVSVTFTANQGYSFNGSQAEDTITRSITVPGSLSGIEPGFAEVVLPQIANVAAFLYQGSQLPAAHTYILEIGETITSEAAGTYAYGQGAPTYEEEITGPGEYGVAPDYGRYEVSFTNCTKSSGYSTGWYPLTTDLSTTATASTGWSFGGSTAGDTQSTGTVHAPYSKTFSPTNIQVTLGGSNCTIKQGSTTGTTKATGTYIVPVNTKFYWMPNTYYSYAAGAVTTTTTYKTVTVSTPGTHSYNPGYGKLANITATRCTADHNTSTYYALGETITFTANQYCAFNSTGTQTTDTSKTVTAGGSPSVTAGYVNVTSGSGTNCTLTSSTGWYAYDASLSWSANTGYAFDNNNKTTTTTGARPGVNTAAANYLRFYTITFSGPTYGSWEETTKTAYHFDKLAKVTNETPNYVVCYVGNSSTVRWSNEVYKATNTNQWTYTTPAVGTVPASVTGAATISATDSRSENSYNVSFTNGAYGSWDSTTAISAPYSAQITKSGNSVTVNGTTRTYTVPTDTTEWDYSGGVSGTFPMTVETGKTITASVSRVRFKYAVSITAGAGISSVYLSTSNTATSGSASGTTYDYGTTVYAFAVLAEHYDIPADSNWVLVSGTKDAAGSKYRVGSVSVTGAHNFGSINAAIEKYILTIMKGTGIATIYYKINGASSYASSTSDVSVSVNDQSTYYYYAVADSYHTANSDCGSSSSPKSGTVNCANILKSVSTTAKTYTLAGEWDNGTVKFYSTSTHTTQITTAAYGSTVYYTLTGDTGYQNGTAGSIVLNSTNFAFASGVAVHDFGGAARISGTLSQGTLPTGVASITCYRKPYNGSDYAAFTSGTIYYGDKFYWTATASTGYNNPVLTYYDASHVYTWTGSQGGSITSVGTSGLTAGLRKSFTITLAKASSHNYFDWKNGTTTVTSMTAYYGDIISTSGNTVTCKKWDATTTNRWQVTATAYSNTTQYSYSTPTVTGGSISSVTSAATITGSNDRTTNKYTITWRYQTAFDTWTNVETTYYYGDTPGTTTPQSGTVPTPSTVTKSGNLERWLDGSWDSLATVTGNRTITRTYTKQYNVTSVNGTHCTPYTTSAHSTQFTIGWKNSGTTIYWLAADGYGWDASGTIVTAQNETVDAGGNYDLATTHVNVTSVNGTHCTAYTSSAYSTQFTTGWKANGITIYWKAATGYCFDQSTNADTTTATVVAGNNNKSAAGLKRYVLTISVTGGSYGGFTVKRGTTVLNNGDYIYYGDELTATSYGNGTSYGNWNITSVTAPTFTTTGEATTGNLTVTNKDSHTATLYYNTTSAVGGTSLGSTASNGTQTKTGLSFDTTYYISARVSRSRDKYQDATDGTQYSGTASVTGNVTATFKFKRTTTTDTGTIDSSVVAAKTAARTAYTVTWKYRDTYSTWTTTTTSVYWGANPSAPVTPATVTSGNSRLVPTSWDNTATIYGARTITMGYQQQYNATIEAIRCTYTCSDGNNASGWHNAGTVITWTRNNYCAFNSAGTQTTTTATINSGTTYSANALYVNVTKLTGTHCSTTATTGWYEYATAITWNADTAYAFNTSNLAQTTTNAVPGENTCSAPYVKRYTLTISVTNSSYGSYSVSRTSSPYQGASTGALSSGATIYYGDVLTGTHSANSDSATSWGDWPTVASPAVNSNGDSTTGNLTITNLDTEACTLYYHTSASGAGTSLGSAASGAAKYVSGLSFETTYYGYASKTITRTGSHYHYTDSSTYSGTNGVTGAVTATFSFGRNTVSDSESTTGYSARVAKKTAARNSYTITWKYLSAYPDTWTTTTESYLYGQLPNRSSPSVVTSGNYRKRANIENYLNGWDSLAAVTAARTITCQYVNQVYITFSGTRCSCTSHSTGWYDTSSTAFSTTWAPSSNCSFNSSGTNATHSESVTPNAPKTVSVSAGYIYVTVGQSYCKSVSKSTGWHAYNTQCTWTALDGGYSFAYTTQTTATDNFTTPGGTYTKSAHYAYVTVNYNHCTPISGSTTSSYLDLDASATTFPIKAVAASDWSFGGSTGGDQTSYTVAWPTEPKSVTVSPSYFYVTVNTGANCTANQSSGWWSSNKKITWTPATYYSFDAGATQTTKEVTTNGPGTYPSSAATPTNIRAASITTGSYNDSVNRNSSTYYASGTTIVWTAKTNYAYNSSGSSTSSGVTLTAGGSFSLNPTYVKCTIGNTHCTSSPASGSWVAVGTNTITYTASDGYSFAAGTSQTKNTYSSVVLGTTSYSGNANYKYITVSGTDCSANVATGYRQLGATITWTGDTGTLSGANVKYSFSNSPISNPTDAQRKTTETIVDTKSDYSKSADYRYVQISVTKDTGFSTNYANGDYVLEETSITYTVPGGTSTRKISFSTSSATTTTANAGTVGVSTRSFSTPTYYVWMNCTCTGTHCSATSTWYRVGTSITWTGESGTNYKYGFTSNTTWSDSYATTTTTVVDGTSSYSKTASYLYYNVTITKNTGTASASHSSGYLLNGTSGVFTATANTSSIKYSYSNSSADSHTQAYTVSSAGQSISSGTVYTWYYITVNANTNSSVTANGSGWYLSSSTAKTSTWTVSNSTAYTFNSDHTAAATTTKTWTPNQAQTVTAPTVYTRYYTVTFAKAADVSGLSTGSWSTASAWVPYGTTWSTSGATVTLSGSQGSSTYTKGTATGYDNAYTISPTTGTVNGNKTITGTTNYTRIKWSLTINKGDYVNKYYYSYGSGTVVEIPSATAQLNDLDYDTAVTITATSDGEAPYNYTLHGAGTFTVNGGRSQNTTVYYTRTVKSYTLTISATGTDYASSYGVTRNSSPYKGAATGALSNGATIYYGDTLSASYTAADTRYGNWDVSSLTAPAISTSGDVTKPTIYVTNNNDVQVGAHIAASDSIPQATSYTISDGQTVTITDSEDNDIQYGSTVYVWFSYSQWRNYWTRSGSVNQSSATVSGNTTFSFTFTESAAQQQTNTIYSNYTSKTVANRNTYTITFNKPTYGSWGSATKTAYYGTNLTKSGNTISGSNASGSWSNTLTATAANYYSTSASITSTLPITVNGAKTITTTSSRTAYKYSIQAYSRTGGTVYWSTSQITTSGGSTTLSNISYGTTVYWRIAASTGYNRPSTYYGSMTLDSTNFTISSTTGDGNASYKGSAIPNCSRISGTLSQGTLPTGVASITCYRKAWNVSSYTVYTGSTIYYGDKFYWTATADTNYRAPTLTYYNSSHVYTWSGAQGGSITSVGTSGLQPGAFDPQPVTSAEYMQTKTYEDLSDALYHVTNPPSGWDLAQLDNRTYHTVATCQIASCMNVIMTDTWGTSLSHPFAAIGYNYNGTVLQASSTDVGSLVYNGSAYIDTSLAGGTLYILVAGCSSNPDAYDVAMDYWNNGSAPKLDEAIDALYHDSDIDYLALLTITIGGATAGTRIIVDVYKQTN